VIRLTLVQRDIILFTKEIIESFAHFIEIKKCKLIFVSEFNELLVWFDTEKLEKILYNLIFNAIKFNSEQGTIIVNISTGADKIKISVKDSGVGIHPQYLELIFERYYQVEKSQSFYKGGSGIGLAHTKELVKIHKGEITVKSTEMEGTEFIVMLPLNKKCYEENELIFRSENDTIKDKSFKKADTSSMIAAFEEDNTGKNKINVLPEGLSITDKPSVLVIEDDLDMHQYIVNCLQQQFNIYQAYNGTEGYNLAVKNNPDVIISDVMMEHMDGIELCNKIKTELQVCHIPVILLTALASIENQIIGFGAGADDYITKPFDAKLLLIRVHNIIQSRNMLREVYSKTLIVEPHKITINSIDEEFLKKAIHIVENNISDTKFSVDLLCDKMHVSRSVFYRKIKNLTNESSNDFIKSLRLKRAAQLLKDSDLSITQISYEVGFGDQKYFSKNFRKYFGISPSDYVKKES
jgi:DNA-binding response OmpR family regulator